MELDSRQPLLKNSPLTIIERSKARAREDSRGVSPGAPRNESVGQLQSPRPEQTVRKAMTEIQGYIALPTVRWFDEPGGAFC